MANRDEILINFQAITGLEDLATCLDILEQKGWDMASAVNSVMPQPDFHSSSARGIVRVSDSSQSRQFQDSSNGASRSVGFVDLTESSSSASTSVPYQERAQPYIDVESYSSRRSDSSRVVGDVSQKGPLCELGVNYGTRLITIFVPPSTTVAQVKRELELRTGLLPNDQLLTGWQSGGVVSDEATLESVGVTGGVCYHLTLVQNSKSFHAPVRTLLPPTLPPVSHAQATSFTSSHEETVQGSSSFSMPVLVGEQITHRLVTPFSVDPIDLSVDGRSVSSGRPGTAGSDLESPVIVSSPSSSSHYSDAAEHISSDEDEAQCALESFDDGMFDDGNENPVLKAMKEPLIPRGCLEPYEALQFFTHAFEARYGAMHPLFLIGTLSDAVNEATAGSATSGTRKPMFVYLHHDASVLSNIFCSQLLCSESIVNYLTTNFVSWAWDLTLHESRIKLLQMVEECFGKVAKNSVDEIRADHLPAILIAYKVKGNTEIRNIIQGETNLDSLMTTLITAVDDHSLNIEREAMEERERLMREHMIAEQNRAYQESLIADKEKARQRQEEELVRLKKERQDEQEKLDREERREAMEVCVPDEPSPDCADKMCTLRIRYPDGSQVQRRFLAKHQLQDLLHLLGSQGYLASDYRILTSFPRKDITERNPGDTFEEANLCPQETVFVEER